MHTSLLGLDQSLSRRIKSDSFGISPSALLRRQASRSASTLSLRSSVGRHGRRSCAAEGQAAKPGVDGASVPGSWRRHRHVAAAAARPAAAAAATAIHALLSAAVRAAFCLRAGTHGCADAGHQAAPPGGCIGDVLQLCLPPCVASCPSSTGRLCLLAACTLASDTCDSAACFSSLRS